MEKQERRARDRNWQGIDTLKYQSRHCPVRCLKKMRMVAAAFSPKIKQEQVHALALEYGLEVLQRSYIEGALSPEATEKIFLEDFDSVFRSPEPTVEQLLEQQIDEEELGYD